MERIYCIVNPVAGGGRALKQWPEIENKMKIRALAYDYYITQAPLEATLQTRRALEQGYQVILAVGGDGTLNEVVNGFFHGRRAINPDACLAVASCGSGGDFIRSAGIPRNLDQALDLVRSRNTRLIDLGLIKFSNHYQRKEERYFINIAGCGIEGEIVYRVNNSSKRLGGFLSFLKGTLTGLLMYRYKNISLTVDGQLVHAGSILAVAAANGQYLGSGMHMAPEADLADGQLDVIVIGAMSRAKMLASLPRLYKGTHLVIEQVHAYRGSDIQLHTVEQVRLDVDGEQPGFLDAEISVVHGAIRLIC